jgi:hypothetical protein
LQVKIRERLFAVKRSETEEISPINLKDVGRVDKKLEGPSTKKKKLNNELVNHDVKNGYLINFRDKLTNEQKEIVDAINANYNIFFTGK